MRLREKDERGQEERENLRKSAPEVSSDLQAWQSGAAHVTQTILVSTTDGDLIQATDRTPFAPNQSRFMRLRVECAE